MRSRYCCAIGFTATIELMGVPAGNTFVQLPGLMVGGETMAANALRQISIGKIPLRMLASGTVAERIGYRRSLRCSSEKKKYVCAGLEYILPPSPKCGV